MRIWTLNKLKRLLPATGGALNGRAPWLAGIPITMVFAGVLWFAVTEFLMLMRNRVRR